MREALRKFVFVPMLVLCLVSTFACGGTALAAESNVIFTAEESEYISEHPHLKVGFRFSGKPVTYTDEEGQMQGITGSLMRTIAQRTGLSFDYILMDKDYDVDGSLTRGDLDIVVQFENREAPAGSSTVHTDTILTVPMVLIVNGGQDATQSDDSLTYVLKRGFKPAEDYIAQNDPNGKIVYVDTNNLDDCLKAMSEDKADATFMNTYTASYLLQKPRYKKMRVISQIYFPQYMSLGVYSGSDPRLLSILNKTIRSLGGSEVQQIVLANTAGVVYDYTAEDVLYEYWPIIVLMTLLAISLLVIVAQQRRDARKKVQSLQREKELVQYHDQLTGCYNSEGFKREVLRQLAKHPDWQYVLWYADIIGFKYLNERFGRDEADRLLRLIARSSTPEKEEAEVVGRLSGDRFLILAKLDEQLLPLYESKTEHILNFFKDRGIDYDVKYKAGGYVLTEEDRENPDVDRMVAKARVAQNELRKGGTHAYKLLFNPNQFEKEYREMQISMRLEAALENGEIRVYLQPQYDCRLGCITSAEALCRWKHPEYGWISPGEFISTLENMGQIYDLDRFVWEEACKLLQKLHQAGRAVPVSVNLDRKDILEREDIPQIFDSLTQKYEIPHELLRIEITESSYMENSEVLIRTLGRLQGLGFTVEMDDFGSGYSSLNMLKEVPVDTVKLDLKFLASDGSEGKGDTILNHIIQMINDMGMGIVAEGVETLEQSEKLQKMGCFVMQGYYYYRPMPAEEFEKLLG